MITVIIMIYGPTKVDCPTWNYVHPCFPPIKTCTGGPSEIHTARSFFMQMELNLAKLRKVTGHEFEGGVERGKPRSKTSGPPAKISAPKNCFWQVSEETRPRWSSTEGIRWRLELSFWNIVHYLFDQCYFMSS